MARYRAILSLALLSSVVTGQSRHRIGPSASTEPLSPAAQAVVEAWRTAAAPWHARLTAIPAAAPVAISIAERVAIDQGLRELLYPSPTRDLPPAERAAADARIWADLAHVDRTNTTYLKSVLPTDGWFRIKRDGRELAANAWLLVQHSPDQQFQREIVARMKPLVATGDARGADYALLYDRTEMFAGRRQYYGSQFSCRNGRRQPEPIRDAAHVDARRKAVGLDPLAHYAATMNALSGC